MAVDNLQVVRGEFSMEDPWAVPRACEVLRLRRSTDGGAPRLATTVAAYFDDEFLNVIFSAADDHVVATFSGHDEPLYNEDVVEVFLAPERRNDYFEIEVNPIGAVFDAQIHSPEESRATMDADVAWNCEGLVVAIRKSPEATGSMVVDTVMRIPFRALDRPTPVADEAWYANFFRIDRHPQEGDEYTAWRPTMRNPPDFHVPGAFARLIFSEGKKDAKAFHDREFS
jgi:hypothetical protein